MTCGRALSALRSSSFVVATRPPGLALQAIDDARRLLGGAGLAGSGVPGQAVEHEGVDHEQQVGRVLKLLAAERLDGQAAAEVVPGQEKRRRGSASMSRPSGGSAAEEWPLVGVLVVDHVPGAKPGLAVTDHFQTAATPIVARDVAEQALDRRSDPARRGRLGEDQVVEVVPADGDLPGIPDCRLVSFPIRGGVQTHKFEQCPTHLGNVFAELLNLISPQGVSWEGGRPHRPREIQTSSWFLEPDAADDLMPHGASASDRRIPPHHPTALCGRRAWRAIGVDLTTKDSFGVE